MLLDTSVVIAYLDPDDRATAVAGAVIDGLVRSGRNPGLISMVTVTEVLVGPARSGDREVYAEVVDFLTQLPGLRLREIDFRVAERAATLRARLGLRAADALIVATGVAAGVGRIVSNDRDWATRLRSAEVPATVVLLDDHLPFSA
ncbi:MAG TPA: PIN domain-containing protein [Candidatus Limnocylindria bacterium]|nr:PIN domain-containing protein [Candidatus Limnocylindria bacterium]